MFYRDVSEHGVKRIELNFLKSSMDLLNATIFRVVEHDKAECAQVAAQWGHDYWDGDQIWFRGL